MEIYFFRMCRGCNYHLSPSTHFAVRSHWIGSPGDHHFACIFSNVIKQMKDKEIRQVCMKDTGGLQDARGPFRGQKSGLVPLRVFKLKSPQ